jgi:hypothetical protein
LAAILGAVAGTGSLFKERIPPFTAGVNPTTTTQTTLSSNVDI